MSAVADNVPVYDSFYGGWLTVGGTSISSPLIAGVYALAGNARSVQPGYVYAHARSLFDITKGNNSCFVTAPAGLRGRLPVRGEEGLRRSHRPGHPGRHRRLLRVRPRPPPGGGWLGAAAMCGSRRRRAVTRGHRRSARR